MNEISIPRAVENVLDCDVFVNDLRREFAEAMAHLRDVHVRLERGEADRAVALRGLVAAMQAAGAVLSPALQADVLALADPEVTDALRKALEATA